MKLGIVGCKGRLGRLIVAEAVQSDSLEIAAVVRPSDDGVDIGTLAGLKPLGTVASSNLEHMASHVDALIDVSVVSAAPEIAHACATHRTGLVCGVTGHGPDELQALHTAATQTPVLIAANFSLGLNLLLSLVHKAAATLGPEYDIEISDMHHRNKVDSPSGTALALGQAAATGRGVEFNHVVRLSREGQVGARPTGEIGFATLRGGAVVGQHTVMFAADQEEISLSHHARDRRLFATGALRAASWLHGQDPGLYSMEDVLGLGPSLSTSHS